MKNVENKTIAQFMGAVMSLEDHTTYNEDGTIKYTPNEDGTPWIIETWSRPEGLSEEIYKRYGWGDYTMGKWHYNSSWDWLMPVYHKCQDISHQHKDAFNETFNLICFNNIDFLYNSIVEFIKYINNNSLSGPLMYTGLKK